MLLRNLIYILQLNLYNLRSFLKFSYTHLIWWRLEKRAHLTWTKKSSLIYVIALFILGVILLLVFFHIGILGLSVVFLEIIFLPVIISLATIIVYPADRYFKNRLIRKAKAILRQKAENITVIGITGSYGKTSAREILAEILSAKYGVVKLPENINTDIGIADFIVKNPTMFSGKEIFIVEMGAYKIGDIKNICKLVVPDYAMLTGINEAHLERFGNLENIIQAKFELPLAVKKMSVLNLDDKNIRKNQARFSLKNFRCVTQETAREIKCKDNFQGLEFKVEEQLFQTKLLAAHNITLILLALEIAKELGMTLGEIAFAVGRIGYIAHRLEPIYNDKTDVWVLDDSYNGNFDGIVSGLEVLARARGRRLVLTPGLVELGKKTEAVHNKIGRFYADKKIDLVMLIKSPATPFIVAGMQEKHFKNYRIFDSTIDAHAALPEIVKSGDTIIFQNDLTDNYF